MCIEKNHLVVSLDAADELVHEFQEEKEDFVKKLLRRGFEHTVESDNVIILGIASQIFDYSAAL